MVVFSSIELASGGTVYYFSYIVSTIKGSINSLATFVAEMPNGITEVQNVKGMYRKSISFSGAVHTDQSGTPTAAEAIFTLAEFLRTNLDKQMRLKLQFDGGALVKEYLGKIVGELIMQLIGNSPEEVVFSFEFIVEGASWS